jgi:hypothetical protein
MLENSPEYRIFKFKTARENARRDLGEIALRQLRPGISPSSDFGPLSAAHPVFENRPLPRAAQGLNFTLRQRP